LASIDVAVVGGGITGLVSAYILSRQNTNVVLIEESTRLGGKIATEKHGDFLVEAGPESLVRHKPAALTLCQELGLESELIEPKPENRKTFLLFKGRLVELPEGILSIFSQPLSKLASAFLSTPLLSFRAKWRLFLEPFVPANSKTEDESVESFFVRRIGKEFFQNLLEPLFSGVYGGNAGALSMKSLLPIFYEAEKKYGSLFKSAWNTKIKEKPQKSVFVSLKNGLGSMVEKIVQGLSKDQIFLGKKVLSIAKKEKSYLLFFETGETLEAKNVLLAVPAFSSAKLVQSLDEDLAAVLQSIPYASALVFTFGFKKNQVKNKLQGYGYLVPKSEKLPLLACTWSSSKWENRAPKDTHLLRCYSDGNQDPQKLQVEILKHLCSLFQIEGDPCLSLIHLHKNGLPQYVVGHEKKLEKVKSLLSNHPGLFIAGSSLYGVGIADCVASGKQIAQAILEDFRQTQENG